MSTSDCERPSFSSSRSSVCGGGRLGSVDGGGYRGNGGVMGMGGGAARGDTGGGIGGKVGWVTTMPRSEGSSPSSSETLARTASGERLPASSCSASIAPPCCVTVSCASAPTKLVPVSTTPLSSRLGICELRGPETSDRVSLVAAALPDCRPRRARRRPSAVTAPNAHQSCEVDWHAASRLPAASASVCPALSSKKISHDCDTVTTGGSLS